MRTFSVICIFLFQLAAEAQPLNPQICSASPDPRDIQILGDAFKPYVRTTKRIHHFYHYGTRGTLNRVDARRPRRNYVTDEAMDLPSDHPYDYEGPVPLKSDVAEQYFRRLSKNFFGRSSAFSNWDIGYGLYAAMDPMTSASYMGEPGFLLEITTPKGFTYLDFRQYSQLAYLPLRKNAAEVVAKLIKQGQYCEPEPKTDFDDQLTNFLVLPEVAKLPLVAFMNYKKNRATLLAVFKRLRIEAILNSWNMPLYQECVAGWTAETRKLRMIDPNDPTNISGDDMVFVRPESAQRLNFKIYVEELEEQPSAEKRQAYQRIYDYYRLFQQQPNLDRSKWLPSHGGHVAEHLLQKWAHALDSTAPISVSTEDFFGCSTQPEYRHEGNNLPEFYRSGWWQLSR